MTVVAVHLEPVDLPPGLRLPSVYRRRLFDTNLPRSPTATNSLRAWIEGTERCALKRPNRASAVLWSAIGVVVVVLASITGWSIVSENRELALVGGALPEIRALIAEDSLGEASDRALEI